MHGKYEGIHAIALIQLNGFVTETITTLKMSLTPSLNAFIWDPMNERVCVHVRVCPHVQLLFQSGR